MSQRPLCFVLMPFGKKPTVAGATVDFDAVYHDLIAPAVDAAGLEPSAPTRRWPAASSTSRCSSG